MLGSISKTLLHDPHEGSDRFLLASSSDLKLCCLSKNASIKTLAVCSDLPLVKAVAWSPNPQYEDLIAAGLTSGKILLLRLNDSQHTPLSVASYSTKMSRPVNSVSFCPSDHSIFAAGYDKARENSLQIFDVNSGLSILSYPTQTETPIRTYLGDSPTDSRRPSPVAELRAIRAACPSESITATTFLHSNRPLLVAGISGKWIRCYDLRMGQSTTSIANPSHSYTSKIAFGLEADPFCEHRFASFGEDTVVRVWDIRKNDMPVLSFSTDYDTPFKTPEGSISRAKSAMTALAAKAAVSELRWSPYCQNVFATLEKDATTIKSWTLGTIENINRSMPVDDVFEMDEIPSSELRVALVHEQRTKPLHRAPLSFAYAQQPHRSDSSTFVIVSKDGHSTASINAGRHLAWTLEGELAVTTGQSSYLYGQTRPKSGSAHPKMPRSGEIIDTQGLLGAPSGALAARRTSTHSRQMPYGDATKQKIESNSDSSKSPSRSSTKVYHSNREVKLLDRDVSVIMRQRALSGFAADAHLNSKLCDYPHGDVWKWLAYMDAITSDSKLVTDTFDFSFAGVTSIISGTFSSFAVVQPTKTNNRSEAAVALSSIMQDSPGAHFSKRNNMEVKANEDKLNSTIARLAQVFDASTSKILVGTQKTARRKLAMALCGPDFVRGSLPDILKRYKAEGLHEKAAAVALFCGETKAAIDTLKNHEDQQLRLIAPTLAAYLDQKNSSAENTTYFRELCSSLNFDEPYLRAMFALIGGTPWLEVVEEDALPLQDRIGLALQHLNDAQLDEFLRAQENSRVRSGDLEGLLLTGLGSMGTKLLQEYINRTSDCQTSALIATFMNPLRPNNHQTLQWIESYRRLLDQWSLYHVRAKFDIHRGNRLRNAASQLEDENKAEAINSKIATPTLVIRCNYCNENISSRFTVDHTGKPRRPTNCACGKPLPRCCVCLESMGVHSWEYQQPEPFMWCHRCRHGGHASELMEWFQRGNESCPVAECECLCRGDR